MRARERERERERARYPPRDGKGFKGFLPHWTNSILQQLKRKFWKIADALFRISRMTNSFK
jgi:hypothetical protein